MAVGTKGRGSCNLLLCSWPALPDSGMWRTIALEWTVNYEAARPKMTIAWFIDGKKSKVVSSEEWFCNSCTEKCADGTPKKLEDPLAPFNQPFYIILNLAAVSYTHLTLPTKA